MTAPQLRSASLLFVLAMVAAVAAALAVAGRAAGPWVAEERVPRQVVVRFDADAGAGERAAARASVGARVGRRLGLRDAELWLLPEDVSVPRAVRVLEDEPAVRYAEANTYAEAASTCPGLLVDGAKCIPDDPRFPELYDLDNRAQTVVGNGGGVADADVDAVEAWNITRGSSDVVVAVVDSGIAYDNPDLAPNLWTNGGERGTDAAGRDRRSNGVDDDANGYVDDWRGWDVVGRSVTDPSDADNDPRDISGHGTHVAGTIGARANNGTGVPGLNWDVRLMNVRVRAERSNETSADIADAFVYAARNGARVVNVSLSSRYYSQYLYDVVKAYPDVLFVVAAGNDGLDLDRAGNHRWPCEYKSPNLICVGATGRADELASWSNRGANTVDLAAPGMILWGSQPAYRRHHSDSFDTDPFAAPARWRRGTATGSANRWTLSTTNRRARTSLTSGAPQPGSDTYVELVEPLDLRGRMGCELRFYLWQNADAASGLYVQARRDRSFLPASRTPAQDTPNPTGDTVAFYTGRRSRATPRLNVSDLDGEGTVHLRFGVLRSSSSTTAVEAWIDDLQLHCLGGPYGAGGRDQTDLMAGTSMATPHVAGTAALMLARDPGLTVARLRQGLLRAVDARPSLTGRTITGGRLNTYKALAHSRAGVRGDVLRVVAGEGQSNRFRLTRQDDTFRIADDWTPQGQSPMGGSRLLPGAGCIGIAETKVSCPASAVASIDVQTSDLDDTVEAAPDLGVPVTVDQASSTAPSVSTSPASGVSRTSATIGGTVDPAGHPTTYRFEYGTTLAYGQATPEASAGGGTGEQPVTATLTGLQPGTTYHYRLVATNAGGTTEGAGRTFTTLADESSGYAATVLADDPIAYWRLGDASGTIAADRRGAHPGTYTGTHTLGAAGALADDPAVRFAGGAVTVRHHPALNTANSFTFEAWIKPDRLGVTQGLAAKGAAYMIFLNSGNRLVLRKPNVGTIAVARTAIRDTTTFHHIAVTKDGAAVKLYLDGADVTGPVTARTLVDGTSPLTLAAGAGAYRGVLDEAALYRTALSAGRIAAHHQARSG